MSAQLVIVTEARRGLRTVAMNRPHKRNALSIELRQALAGTFRELERDQACRAVLLRGQGAHFCAGMDVTQFGGDRENALALLDSTRGLFDALLEFPKPVVAAVRGAAVGGGFAMALCCDARVACEDAYFGFFEVKRGIPAPYEIVRLYASEPVARDWCETGRRIDAREAREAGLVERVVRAERLLDAAHAEAQGRKRRQTPPGLRAAFAQQMARFEAALLGREVEPGRR